MQRVTVSLGERSYDIVIGPGAMKELGAILRGRRRVAVVSQASIRSHWSSKVEGALAAAEIPFEWFEMPDGELHKRMATVEQLSEAMSAWGLLRNDAVVALGGGIVGDTAGFTAASYHRGVSYVQAPTTLLGMVDAAIGGKTGVNLAHGKNLVGAFHQPLAVVADTETLMTLPDREYRCGLGEVAKYAWLEHLGPDRPGARSLYDLVVAEQSAIEARVPAILEDLVVRCAAIKAAVVAADERELTGIRATLNYGHTFAHALETVGEHELAHGEAVAVGLVFAAELAGALERIDRRAVERHRALLELLSLPTRVPSPLAATTREEYVALMRRDKKASGGLTFMLLGDEGITALHDPAPAALAAAFEAVGVGA